MSFKKKLLQYCFDFIDQRIAAAREAIRMAQQSANEETKSSSGDKYETGRAMAQLEIEKINSHMSAALVQKSFLEHLDIASSEKIRLGSLVFTDRGNFFIAVSVGRVDIEGIEVTVVSAQSPIGKSLLTLRAGDAFAFNKNTYVISRVE